MGKVIRVIADCTACTVYIVGTEKLCMVKSQQWDWQTNYMPIQTWYAMVRILYVYIYYTGFAKIMTTKV